MNDNYVVLTMDQIVETRNSRVVLLMVTLILVGRVFNKDPEKKDIDLMYTLQSNYRSGIT